jgi:PKD repeat protein
MKHRSLVAGIAAAALAVMSLTAALALPAQASQPSVPAPTSSAMVSDVPSTKTPAVNDGDVRAIAKVGSTMVIGGNFTQVDGVTRNRLAAFDAGTGALTSFDPSVNGEVSAIVPGVDGTSVWIGGSFTLVGSTTVQNLALVDLATGQVRPLAIPRFNTGVVKDLVLRGNRLYAVGTFVKVGTALHTGIASFDATTGKLDPFVNVQFAGHHNTSPTGAQGPVGPWDLDVTADGRKMVVIGNFTTADGLPRDQVAQVDLSGAQAAVRTDWATLRYTPLCFNFAFDSYVRGVSYSPDGAYFVIASTGGGVTNTLCDAAARFETDAVGAAVEPTWISETGGDTTWGVTITNNVVYVGGHQRWANNPFGSDQAKPGAVPRPGLMALEPINGRPLKWNPGRNPPGKAVYAVLATADGLYVGSNTDWVGNFKYKREKIAFFPYAGGDDLAPTTTGPLPGTVYLGGSRAVGTTNVLYRVNAGGPAIQSLDGGPDWSADDGSSSTLRNSGSNAAGWDPVPTVDGTVPSTAPGALFSTERWDPSGGNEMQWSFPVPAGTPVQVRVYLANRCGCTSTVGSRVFDVDAAGGRWLDRLDLVSAVGHQVGTMRKLDLTVPASGVVDLKWVHETENPLVNGIEIVRTNVTSAPPADADALSSIGLTPTSATTPQPVTGSGIPWGSTRGAFMVGNRVFFGQTDGYLYRASFDGTTFGAATRVDPYHDPLWANVDNNLGGTFDGALPTLYAQMPNVTGMFYASGRLYYTLFNDPKMHWRWFSPDSGIVDERTFDVTSSISFKDANGMFAAGGRLYFASKETGDLSSVAFSGGTVSGSTALVSGPGKDGIDWRNRSLFLSNAPPPNQAPTAGFTSSCSAGACTFDGSGSTDPDGTIASYAWDFGDGSTGTGVSPNHTYVDSGTRTVGLTVKDDRGASGTVERTVTVAVPTNPIGFVGAAHSAPGAAKFKAATVPTGTVVGDTMLLFLTTPSTVAWSAPSGVTGWTQVNSHLNGTVRSTMWTKTATAADLGRTARVDDPSGLRLGVLQLLAYHGVDGGSVLATVRGDSATATHASANVAARAGDWVATYYSDKSSATTSWTAPGTVTVRDSMTADPGSARFSAFVVDSGAPVPAGTYGGITSKTDATGDRTAIWSVAMSPKP